MPLFISDLLVVVLALFPTVIKIWPFFCWKTHIFSNPSI